MARRPIKFTPEGRAADGDLVPAVGTVLTWGAEGADFLAAQGGAPSGAAGGDLGGTYPNPTIPALTELEVDIVDLETLKAPLASPTFTGTVTVPAPVNSTDAASKSYVDAVTINAQTGTSYTHVLSDGGKLITFNNAGAVAFTVDSNAHVASPVGTQIQLLQLGAGQVTVGITADTLNGTPGLKLRAQYSMATLVKIGSTTWVLSGDLSA